MNIKGEIFITIKSDQGLLVSKKAEALLLRVYPALVNFPKAEKIALCVDIKQNFYNLIKFIEMANSVKSKRVVYAQEADGHLQTLKILMKVARHRKYISKGFFREIDANLTEINKMLSGFIRSKK